MSEELASYLERVRKVYLVHGAILFGSWARGEQAPWSDVDILIIADFEEPYLERLKKLLEMTEVTTLPLEPHQYTLDETLKMLEVGNATVVDALEKGIVVYEDEQLGSVRKKYMELKAEGKLRGTDHTISI